MTRLHRDWVASLAVLTGLVLGGCGRTEPQPMQVSKPPSLFAVPEELTPLPHVVLRPVEPIVQPVQAQYAQAASPPAESIYAPQPSAPPTAAPAPQLHGPQQVSPPAAAAKSGNSSAGEQTIVMIERANQMARKGMLFAARNELVQALQLVAHANDVRHGTTQHAAALAAGLTALKEADDFSEHPGGDSARIGAHEIARSHRTTILHSAGEFSPLVAQQHYYAFAQQQLALALAGEPAAAKALYSLGKIQMALAGPASQTQSLHGPRAMVCYQAALAVDSRNYQAANELGVLLARYGQWTEARRALLHSVTIQPHVEGWHNLAAVHRRLGETELAQLAENERRLLASKPPTSGGSGAEKIVTWVDPQTFATAAASTPNQRR